MQFMQIGSEPVGSDLTGIFAQKSVSPRVAGGLEMYPKNIGGWNL